MKLALTKTPGCASQNLKPLRTVSSTAADRRAVTIFGPLRVTESTNMSAPLPKKEWKQRLLSLMIEPIVSFQA